MKKYIILLTFLLFICWVKADTFNQYPVYSNQIRLCKNFTHDKLGVDLFAVVGEASLCEPFMCEGGMPSERFNIEKCIIDPYWNRVICGREGAFLKAIGGNGTFKRPVAVQCTPEGINWVIDIDCSMAPIYYIDAKLNMLPSPIDLTFDDCDYKPVDLCWDDAGTADYNCSSTPYDYMWILYEDGYVEAIQYAVTREDVDDVPVVSYWQQVFEENNVVDAARSMAKGRALDNACLECDAMGNDGWIYFSEGPNQIKCYTIDLSDTYPTLDYEFTSVLLSGTVISSIDVSPTGIVWITDTSSMRFLMYYNNGSSLEYLDQWGTYGTDEDQTGQLNYPRNVAFGLSIGYDTEFYYRSYAGLTAAERWTSTTGGINGT